MGINSAEQLAKQLGLPKSEDERKQANDISSDGDEPEDKDPWEALPELPEGAPSDEQLAPYMQAAYGELQQLSQAAHQLDAMMRSPQMEGLKTTNPSRYILKAAEANQQLQQIAARMEFLQNEMQTGDSIHNARRLNSEKRKVLTEIPEWADSKTRAKEIRQLQNWLREKGYTKAEIDTMASSDISRLYSTYKRDKGLSAKANKLATGKVERAKHSGKRKAIEDLAKEIGFTSKRNPNGY
jgi:hypothetical protein